MSQQLKGQLFRALKASGVEFTRHYREYTVDELQRSYDQLHAEGLADPLEKHAFMAEDSIDSGSAEPNGIILPTRPADPTEMPSQRLNTQAEDEPIRIDPDTGLIWYQEEVMKAAFAKPRGRRVLRYLDSGFKEETATTPDGQYSETFEVPGNQSKLSEAKITLPSYQVGIYKDPKMPFRIHIYNGERGFDLFEVENYYGGPDLVPDEVKRKYVENVLCYDIRTTVRAIESEYRRLQLAGKA